MWLKFRSKFHISLILTLTMTNSILGEYSESNSIIIASDSTKEFCNHPSAIENGIWIFHTKSKVSYSVDKQIKIPVGNQIAFKCLSGYSLANGNSVGEKICRSNRQWHPTEDPVCIRKNNGNNQMQMRKKGYGSYRYRYGGYGTNPKISKKDDRSSYTIGPDSPDINSGVPKVNDIQRGNSYIPKQRYESFNEGYEYVDGQAFPRKPVRSTTAKPRHIQENINSNSVYSTPKDSSTEKEKDKPSKEELNFASINSSALVIHHELNFIVLICVAYLL